MQQVSKSSVHYQVVCKNLNPAKMLCISSNCQKSAACCIKLDCETCNQAHSKCKTLRTQILIQKVAQKKQNISEQILKGIRVMQKAYDDAIDRLSKDKQYITSQIDMLGYSETEFKFMKLLQNGIADQITGKMNAKIIQDLNIQNDWVATQQAISKYWKRKQIAFNQLFDKFKTIMKIGVPKLESKITQETDKILQFFGEDLKVLTFKLLYRASEQGFSVSSFHTACDWKKHTLVLARTQFGRIIGGYTPCEWNQSNNYGDDSEKTSFLFSLTNNEKYPITQTSQASYGATEFGPTFGGGHDFYIGNNSNTQRQTSYFNFPHSYNNGKYVAGQQAQLAFCGSPDSYYALVQEWEVFQVQLI